MVFHKQAHIHPQPLPPSSPSAHQRKVTTEERNGERRRGRGSKKCNSSEKLGEEREIRDRPRWSGKIVVHVQPLTSEEKLEANVAIEKQK